MTEVDFGEDRSEFNFTEIISSGHLVVRAVVAAVHLWVEGLVDMTRCQDCHDAQEK